LVVPEKFRIFTKKKAKILKSLNQGEKPSSNRWQIKKIVRNAASLSS
jgi:hypothetical protein